MHSTPVKFIAWEKKHSNKVWPINKWWGCSPGSLGPLFGLKSWKLSAELAWWSEGKSRSLNNEYIGKHISNVASRSLTYKAYANQNVCNDIYPFKALKANLGSFKFGPHKRMHMQNTDITQQALFVWLPEFNWIFMVTIYYKY